MLFALLGAVAVYALITVFRRSGQITGDQARQLIEAGARLIDVRTPEEFAQHHLPDAKNVPLRELTSRVVELDPRSVPVVVYCQSGMRSTVAKKLLARAGFSQVFDLGGIGRWRR